MVHYRSSSHWCFVTCLLNGSNKCDILMSLWLCCFQVEIPPTYDDAFEPSESDLDSSGQWFSKSVPSRGPRSAAVTQPADRSGSLQHSRPPRVRSRRHFSDGTDPHRRKRFVALLLFLLLQRHSNLQKSLWASSCQTGWFEFLRFYFVGSHDFNFKKSAIVFCCFLWILSI